MTPLLSLLVLIASTQCFAEELTLSQAIGEAKMHSPAYTHSHASVDEAYWKPLEALSGNIPKVSVNATHFFQEKYQVLNINFGGLATTFPEVYPKTIYNLDLSWTVFDGFQTWNNYRAAKLSFSAAENENIRAEMLVEADISVKFYQTLAAQMLATVAEQNLKTLQDHVERTQSLLKQGEATRFDTLRVDVQLSEAIPEKLSADDQVILTRLALSQAMGLESDSRPLAGEFPTPSPAAVPADVKLDIAHRPDLQALINRSEASDKLASASWGAWAPKVSLLAEKQYYNNQTTTLTSNLSDAYSVGVGLSWNLFDGGATLARQKQALYAGIQSESSSRAALLKAPIEFETWKRRYFTNVALFTARKRAIESADESVRLANIGLKAGTRTNTDVLDAELDLFRARAGVVRAQLEATEALINLQLASGRRF